MLSVSLTSTSLNRLHTHKSTCIDNSFQTDFFFDKLPDLLEAGRKISQKSPQYCVWTKQQRHFQCSCFFSKSVNSPNSLCDRLSGSYYVRTNKIIIIIQDNVKLLFLPFSSNFLTHSRSFFYYSLVLVFNKCCI